MWEVEYTDQFEQWWATLAVDQRSRTSVAVDLLIPDDLYDQHLADLRDEGLI